MARAIVTAALVAAGALSGTAAAASKHVTFGSSLSHAATRDTAANLAYAGTNIPTIVNGQGVTVHVAHDGADTTLWNTMVHRRSAVAPRAGQILTIKLEGCARPASGAPVTATQIHFRDLAPRSDGGANIVATSESFTIPLCGQRGAGGKTVTTYRPAALRVKRGDYVGLAENGGFDPNFYPSGVPYQVIAAVSGSTMDSFIHESSSALSPSHASNHDGFARNRNEELQLQATLR